jgi:hypothetical protein
MRVLRLVGTWTLRTLAALIALAVLAVVVVIALVLWSQHEQNVQLEQAGDRAFHAYSLIHKGSGAAIVRRLAGTPTSPVCCDDAGRPLKSPCWEYGDALAPTTWTVDYCFAHGRLVSKSIWHCDRSTMNCSPGIPR